VRSVGHSFASQIAGMSSFITAVRQVASGLSRRTGDRFCLISERQLAGINGFAFDPSMELTETDVIDSLIGVGYSVRDAVRLIMDARRSFGRNVLAFAIFAGTLWMG